MHFLTISSLIFSISPFLNNSKEILIISFSLKTSHKPSEPKIPNLKEVSMKLTVISGSHITPIFFEI